MSGLISVAQALALIKAHTPVRKTSQIALADALGMTLATDLIAHTSRPPAAVSAMDGYAVRLQDVAKPETRLKLIGSAPAGRLFEETVGPGETVRVFTGSEIPNGADHIVIQEAVEVREGGVICQHGYTEAAYIRPAGLDFKTGDCILNAGTRLGAAELSLAAAANHAELDVTTPLRVGILANGDELRPPGSALQKGQIINSNPAALSALIEGWGGQAVDLGIAPDRLDAIQTVIETAQDIDVFLPVGGASVGDHDHMQAAFAAVGFKPIFSKLAVRPGKPTWFSERGSQRGLGLPGNPASALVCAHLFLAPLIGAALPASFINAELQTPLMANGGREHYMRARVEVGSTGQLVVTPAANQDSSLLTPFQSCNGLIQRLPDAPAEAVGARVSVHLIRPLLG